MRLEDRQEFALLKKHNIGVQKKNQIQFNSGSETLKHRIAKTVVAHVGLQRGYKIASEVEVPGGEVDILLWTGMDRLNYAVECETSPELKTLKDKQKRYVRGPIDDMLTVNVTDCPVNYLEAQEYVQEELGL